MFLFLFIKLINNRTRCVLRTNFRFRNQTWSWIIDYCSVFIFTIWSVSILDDQPVWFDILGWVAFSELVRFRFNSTLDQIIDFWVLITWGSLGSLMSHVNFIPIEHTQSVSSRSSARDIFLILILVLVPFVTPVLIQVLALALAKVEQE